MAELKEQDRKFIVDMFTSLDVDGNGRVNFQELLDSKHFAFRHHFCFYFHFQVVLYRD